MGLSCTAEEGKEGFGLSGFGGFDVVMFDEEGADGEIGVEGAGVGVVLLPLPSSALERV